MPSPSADLHLHTTASDGLDSPAELVDRARRAGLSTIAVVDHDTVSAIPELERLAPAAGLALVPGLEITAVWEGSDVHLLAYFVEPRSDRLGAFLADQRSDRERRARQIALQLAALECPVDFGRVLEIGGGRALSRPILAQAMVESGHVPDIRAAFDRFLAEGQPAFVSRVGATPFEVLDLITAEGGFVSLAHPGVTGRDALIPDLVAGGLGAIEAYHPDHDAAETLRYLALARDLGLAVSGGSDYHGAQSHHADGFGRVGLTQEELAAFCARAGRPLPERR